MDYELYHDECFECGRLTYYFDKDDEMCIRCILDNKFYQHEQMQKADPEKIFAITSLLMREDQYAIRQFKGTRVLGQ